MRHAGAVGNLEKVGHSEAISTYARSHGMSERQVINAIQRYQTASQAGSALALQNLARDLHTDVYGTMYLMKEAGLRESYGRAEGLIKAYNNAKAEYGFTGGLQDCVSM